MHGRRASIAKVQPPQLGEVRQSCTADSCRVEVQQPTAQMQGCPSCSVTQLPQQPMAQAQGCPSSSSAQLPQQPLAPVQGCPSSSSSQLPQQPTTQEQGCPGSNSAQLPQQSTALVQGCPRNGNGTGLPQWATTRELFSAMAKGSAAHGASASDAPRVQHVSPSAIAECACIACERADFEVESECVATAHGSCKLEELVECASAEQLRQGSRCAMIKCACVATAQSSCELAELVGSVQRAAVSARADSCCELAGCTLCATIPEQADTCCKLAECARVAQGNNELVEYACTACEPVDLVGCACAKHSRCKQGPSTPGNSEFNGTDLQLSTAVSCPNSGGVELRPPTAASCPSSSADLQQPTQALPLLLHERPRQALPP
ncbi:hypothetical protein CYMTET_21835, partial [Cymbomonas tetramitiformis]